VAAEALARDWAAANSIAGGPSLEALSPEAGGLPVTRLSWTAPRCRPVVVYRVEGGGHGWPGGPQYLPARLIGPVDRHLDATGILLELARREIPPGAGR